MGVARGAKPVLRIEIRIEGRSNPSDGSLLTISNDLGHLRAYELTYGEQVRDTPRPGASILIVKSTQAHHSNH
jgi:hypothetical protein